MRDEKLYDWLIKTFGKEFRLRLLQEEAAEVIHAVNKYLREDYPHAFKDDHSLRRLVNETRRDDLCNEIADLEILIDEVKYAYELDDYVGFFKHMKFQRAKKLMEGKEDE